MAIFRRGTSTPSPGNTPDDQLVEKPGWTDGSYQPGGDGLYTPTDTIDRVNSGTGSVTTGDGGATDLGNAERPRDRPQEVPTAPIAPEGIPRPGLPGEGAQTEVTPGPETPPPPDLGASTQPPAAKPPQAATTPPMPQEPTPIATEPAAPFVPMTPPPAVMRKSLTGAAQLLRQRG